jgi:hypothetical protein
VTKAPKQKETDTKLCVLVLELWVCITASWGEK